VAVFTSASSTSSSSIARSESLSGRKLDGVSKDTFTHSSPSIAKDEFRRSIPISAGVARRKHSCLTRTPSTSTGARRTSGFWCKGSCCSPVTSSSPLDNGTSLANPLCNGTCETRGLRRRLRGVRIDSIGDSDQDRDRNLVPSTDARIGIAVAEDRRSSHILKSARGFFITRRSASEEMHLSCVAQSLSPA
jgi:hypothetical protein